MAAQALPNDVRARFERFAGRLERLPLEQLRVRAARPADAEGHADAIARAERLADEDGRGAALAEARAAIEAFTDRQFDDALFEPGFMAIKWGGTAGSTTERVRLAVSLQEAVTAVIEWDLLDEGERDELLGPWASLSP